MLSPCNDCGLGLINAHAIQEVRIHDAARSCIGCIAFKHRIVMLTFGNDAGHAEPVFSGEIQVALVMRGAPEDRACAIVHQDEIGDIDRQVPMRIKGMLNGKSRVEALFLGRFDIRGRRPAFATILNESLQVRSIGCKVQGQRMIGRNGHKTCPEHRVRPGGKDINTLG